MICRAIYHDINEVKTGPIKHKTKKELEVIQHIKRLEADFLQENFISYMVEAKDGSYEGKMVDIADKPDALIKINMERRNNQSEYELITQSELPAT